MVDSYSFGRMEISGEIYTSDLIVFPNRIDASWWRKAGHHLCLDDLHEILKEKFDVLIVGTGYWGLMEVDKEVVLHAKSAKFDLIIEKTQKAVELFNTLSNQKKIVAAFHLTC
ncbi:MAG: hypothetical protein JSV17_06905 [Candidatus Aminicenantes bacterium]|nr:MAG: hypothetical protein JSV17_06905 [Candidatus Aminicenantes bacterium]